MSDFTNRTPRIAAPSNARNAFGHGHPSVGKVWANRADLSSYTNDEIHNAHALLLTNAQALRPFYSPERVAFRRLAGEVQRRGLGALLLLLALLGLGSCAPRLDARETATPSRAGLAHAAYVARLEDSVNAKTSRAALVEWNAPVQK